MTMLDWLGPKGIERSPEAQAEVDQQTARLALYASKFCPYCIKVRRTIEALGLTIQECDTAHDPAARQELIHGGGASQVPCLRITDDEGNVHWMYESNDIIAYLQERFA